MVNKMKGFTSDDLRLALRAEALKTDFGQG